MSVNPAKGRDKRVCTHGVPLGCRGLINSDHPRAGVRPRRASPHWSDTVSMIGIQVVSWAGQPPAAPTTAWFGPEGGDIGRSAECTLPLPDPERHISRRHAAVVQRHGRFFLQVLSAGVPVVVDGEPLASGNESVLVAGMQISLGAYTLQVLDEPESLGASRPLQRAQTKPPPAIQAPPALQAPAPPPPAFEPEVDLLVGETGALLAAAPHGAPEHDLASALKRGLGLEHGVG